MDHIHPIQNSKMIPVRVPLVINSRFEPCDGGFINYPLQTGMADDPDTVSVDAMNLRANSIDELAPFLQAWLFFGLLHGIFKTLVRTDYEWSDFVEEGEDGEYFITTQHLPFYIWCWAAYESAIPIHVADYGISIVSSMLRITDNVLDALVFDDKHNLGSFACSTDIASSKAESQGHRVLLSIIVLCETLHNASRRIYVEQHERHKSTFTSLIPTLLQDRLEIAAWCPWQIERLQLSPNMDCSTIYALSMIDQVSLGKDHSRCSVKKCYGYDVDYNTYQSKHITLGCDCSFLPPEKSSVALCVSWILDVGGLPLLSLCNNDNGRPSIKVAYSPLHGSKEIPLYVAVSHVWSDGLGNQEDNSMPLCILEKIQRNVNALYERSRWPVFFWIDTICVPKKNKGPALEAMFETYRNADAVLVLDASIEAVSLEIAPIERLLRISVCPWTQRLWTLQEGWIAKDLYFQFLEDTCSANKLVKDCVKENHPMKLKIEQLIWPEKNKGHIRKLGMALAVDDSTFDLPRDSMTAYQQGLKEAFPNFPRDEDRRLAAILNKSHQFDSVFASAASVLLQVKNRNSDGTLWTMDRARIFDALKLRTTSRLEDEMYCIACLMGLPIASILAVRPAERMKALLTLMPKITATILFSDHCERFKDDGFRWAPKTFMSIHAKGHDNDRFGCVEGGGFRVSLPGMKLNPIQLDDIGNLVPSASSSSDISTVLQMNNDNEEWLYRLSFFSTSELRCSSWSDFKGKNLMLIVRRITPGPQGRITDTVDGALVEFISQDDSARTVRFLDVLWMRRMYITPSEQAGLAGIIGSWLDDDREWRVT